MAGIGFELKRLFRRKGLFATMRAYGYAGIVCTGPMLLGVLLQVGILVLCGLWGVGRANQDLLVCMVTYTLLASLTLASFFSMPVTRFLADMLFAEREDEILPSFWGSNAIMLVAGTVLYGVFLLFSGATLLQGLLCLWLFNIMIVNWNGMSYLTAIKDYRGILCSFAAAIGVACLCALAALALGLPPVEGLLASIALGYGVMLAWDVVLLYRYFPQSDRSPWPFLQWLDQFMPLALTGLLTNLGLFAHLVIIWAGPIGVQVKGLFYGAPYYDVPALIAFLTILVTTVNFVVSVEVNFYPRYHDYYSLFNDGGVVGDIVVAEEEMLSTLNSELRFCALKQLFVTAAVISLETTVLSALPLGFNNLMHGYFRTLCVGYGLYAVGNTVMLILLYFTDYKGAVLASGLFAGVAGLATAASLLLPQQFYGFGFLLGAAVFFIVALLRLDTYTSNLPYRILSQQPIVTTDKTGRFTQLGRLLDRAEQRRRDLGIVHEVHLAEAHAVRAELVIGLVAEDRADAADDLSVAPGQPAARLAIIKRGVFARRPVREVIAVERGNVVWIIGIEPIGILHKLAQLVLGRDLGHDDRAVLFKLLHENMLLTATMTSEIWSGDSIARISPDFNLCVRGYSPNRYGSTQKIPRSDAPGDHFSCFCLQELGIPFVDRVNDRGSLALLTDLQNVGCEAEAPVDKCICVHAALPLS